jgi:hypothetical protein
MCPVGQQLAIPGLHSVAIQKTTIYTKMSGILLLLVSFQHMSAFLIAESLEFF